MYVLDDTPRTGIVNSLFGDGAAAAVLTTYAGIGAGSGVGASRASSISKASAFPSNGRPCASTGTTTPASGASTSTRRSRTSSASTSASRWTSLLERNGLDFSAVKHWVLHTGGGAVIDSVKLSLGLEEHDVRHTRSVLRDYGNISSGSFLVSLERLLAEGCASDGDLGVMVTMGPGAQIETALFQFGQGRMLTEIDEVDGERVLTVRLSAATIDAEHGRAPSGPCWPTPHTAERRTSSLRFAGDGDAVTGDFPSWPAGAGPGRHALFRPVGRDPVRGSPGSKAKTFAAYDGRVGAAAVQLGLVTDLRLASTRARLSLGSLPEGRFPGMGAYWLPKFVGLGNARRMFLLGEDLTAAHAVPARARRRRRRVRRRGGGRHDQGPAPGDSRGGVLHPPRYSTTAICWSVARRPSWPRRRDTRWGCTKEIMAETESRAAQFALHGHRPSARSAVLDRRRAGLRLHRVDEDPSGRRDMVRAEPGPRHQRPASTPITGIRSGCGSSSPDTRSRGSPRRTSSPSSGYRRSCWIPTSTRPTDLPRLDYRDEGSLLAEIRRKVNAKFSKRDLKTYDRAFDAVTWSHRRRARRHAGPADHRTSFPPGHSSSSWW